MAIRSVTISWSCAWTFNIVQSIRAFRVQDLQDSAVARAKAAGHAADDYVHEHPWKAIGAAAGIGMIIGLLIGRR